MSTRYICIYCKTLLAVYVNGIVCYLGVGLPRPVTLDEDAAQDTLDSLEAGMPLAGQQGG